MNTVTPVKATQARVDRILKRCESALTPGQLAALAEIVEYELRCQDRDTRHACAETVLTLEPSYTHAGQSSLDAFRVSAHAACMNVQAV